MRFCTTFAGWMVLACSGTAGALQAEPLQFNRDIRPILSENCFHCHGQDAAKRKADLRLDTLEGALAKSENGAALVPAQPDQSPMLQRMESQDPDESMPPPDSHRTVKPAEIAKVRQWISEGARYETHWAFLPPVRPPVPSANSWGREAWDALVLRKLEAEGLKPAPEATPAAWLRRATFDLTGLGPEPAEIRAFEAAVQERGEAAYVETANRLLASPRYGERMTAEWMDVARYADTHGFNNDSARSMWRWRDWVIAAFNRNLPYNQFVTRQLAGDLLPEAGVEDRIATGFGRNHVINSEGGIIDEEYRVEYVADRVRTLGMAWMGLTLECSRCHDHKYDPISTRDYYRLFAFFNQVPEWGEDGRVANAAPLMAAPAESQLARLHALERDLAAAAAGLQSRSVPSRSVAEAVQTLVQGVPSTVEIADRVLSLESNGENWINAAKPAEGLNGKSLGKPGLENSVFQFPADPAPVLEGKLFSGQSHAAWTFSAAVRWEGREGVLLSSMDYTEPFSSVSHGNGTEFRLTAKGKLEVRMAQKWPAYSIQLIADQPIRTGEWHHLAVVNEGTGVAAGLRVYVDGVESGAVVRHDGLSGGTGAKSLRMGSAIGTEPAPFRGQLGHLQAWSRALKAEECESLADAAFLQLIRQPEYQLEAVAQVDRLQSMLRRHQPETRELWRKWVQQHGERLALQRTFPSVMVMSEIAEPRPTRILVRGSYDAPGDLVEPGVPEALLGSWPAGAPKNRLGLARWLLQPQNPLTARVVVNRFWQQVFGIGLVKTSEDFGFQSGYPAHPEVLDWLSREFADNGWNVKGLMRSLVLSATYRQSSGVSPELYQRDPENQLLARGPRWRLPAEMIRDQALALGGLLQEKLGGPGVYPDQPENLYKGLVVDAPYPGTTWTVSEGADRYRRSLYTFWKRTVPHPVMNVFDTPDREFGCVRRSTTNTPLQALTLMNEPAMLRAAGQFSKRIQQLGGDTDEARLQWGFMAAAGRPPVPAEYRTLARLLQTLRASYAADPGGADAMLQTSGVEADPDHRTDRAAWAAIAGNLLNLDETITKN